VIFGEGGADVAEQYIFEDRIAEQRRLDAQSRFIDPLTERVFREAKVGPGMRVLDLGSGAGHVALLASRLVGPEGSVVGVERDPEAVQTARERVRAAGATNVKLVVGDVQTLDEIEEEFDAVVGRLILMYLSDPAAALRQAAGRLRSGGIIAMHEADLAYDWAVPQTPLWEQVRGWFLQTLACAGVEERMGLRLYRCFVAAGLPAPEMTLESVVAGGPEAPAWGWANLVRGVMPLMERLDVATSADVQPDTLADRLLAELTAENGTLVGPPMIGAWSRVRSADRGCR
jgi:ubiquinone/menaquinone biosynthesis C-methylase UbiE